jgi:hypothetical protein
MQCEITYCARHEYAYSATVTGARWRWVPSFHLCPAWGCHVFAIFALTLPPVGHDCAPCPLGFLGQRCQPESVAPNCGVDGQGSALRRSLSRSMRCSPTLSGWAQEHGWGKDRKLKELQETLAFLDTMTLPKEEHA